MTDLTIPPAVTIDHWQCRVYGERYSVEHDGRTVLTFPTELEARRVCRVHNWIVTANTDTGWITIAPARAQEGT